MNNFIFENTTKIYFGKGCVKEYLAYMVKDSHTVMLIYGGSSIKRNGIYDEVIRILLDAGKSVVEFSGVMSNPTYIKVQEGARLAREQQVDLLLGIGGGSVMDCCKAISMAAVYSGDIWNDFWERVDVVDFKPLPLGVIVTVAGTGSEMNGGAVITNEKKKIKTGRDYPACNPRFALMDPEYTKSVPKQQIVSGGFDILSHIMETYFSAPDEENVSDDISESLMRGVIRDLRALLQEPENYTARSNLMWESTMAENRMIKLGSSVIFNVTKWSISWELISIVIMVKDWRCCTQSITGIFTILDKINLHVLPHVSGEFVQKAKQRRNWHVKALRHWRISFTNWGCLPPCGNLA